MSDMTNLFTYIWGALKALATNVYLDVVADGIAPPYVTFKLVTSTDNEKREDFILEVNVWDDEPSTAVLEALVDSIDLALNRSHYTGTTYQVSMYRINRLMVPDPSPDIRRRMLRYQCQVYFDDQTAKI